MTALEVTANALMALSIWLAARNSIHTWSTGIVACLLFGIMFFRNQLYADATLIFRSSKTALGAITALGNNSTNGTWGNSKSGRRRSWK